MPDDPIYDVSTSGSESRVIESNQPQNPQSSNSTPSLLQILNSSSPQSKQPGGPSAGQPTQGQHLAEQPEDPSPGLPDGQRHPHFDYDVNSKERIKSGIGNFDQSNGLLMTCVDLTPNSDLPFFDGCVVCTKYYTSPIVSSGFTGCLMAAFKFKNKVFQPNENTSLWFYNGDGDYIPSSRYQFDPDEVYIAHVYSSSNGFDTRFKFGQLINEGYIEVLSLFKPKEKARDNVVEALTGKMERTNNGAWIASTSLPDQSQGGSDFKSFGDNELSLLTYYYQGSIGVILRDEAYNDLDGLQRLCYNYGLKDCGKINPGVFVKLRADKLGESFQEGLFSFAKGILNYAKRKKYPQKEKGAEEPFPQKTGFISGVISYLRGLDSLVIDSTQSPDRLTDCGESIPGQFLEYSKDFKNIQKESREAFYEGFAYYLEHNLSTLDERRYRFDFKKAPTGSIFPRVSLETQSEVYNINPSLPFNDNGHVNIDYLNEQLKHIPRHRLGQSSRIQPQRPANPDGSR